MLILDIQNKLKDDVFYIIRPNSLTVECLVNTSKKGQMATLSLLSMIATLAQDFQQNDFDLSLFADLKCQFHQHIWHQSRENV